MATVDTEILNILTSAGIEKDKAEILAAKIITRDEATKTLATKADLESAVGGLIKWVAGMLVGQAALIVALIQLFS